MAEAGAMLRQILRDLWVDPELLAELDEAQRHALFCRMRAEQVRRWTEREQQQTSPPPEQRPPQRSGAKHVDWLLGDDGEPWVWVMGEHPDDLSIEEILAREQSGTLAEETLDTQEDEGEQPVEVIHSPQPQMEQKLLEEPITKQEQHELQHTKKEELMNSNTHEVEESIYCTVDELRVAIGDNSTEKRGALQEISLNMPERAEKVSQRVALWERRVAEERNVQRPQRRRREITARQAEELRLQQEEEERAWREQERKAKEAEQQIREIARRAREEHRRTSVLAMEVEPSLSSSSLDSSSSSLINSLGSVSPTAKPPSTEAVVQWFRSSEVARRAGLAPGTNLVATWFHGLISRQEAELRLESAPVGSFLVRVSERVWGYAISYRAIERCKHFLIDASSGHYQFLGANQLSHSSLGELVEYHARHPITVLGGEQLLHSCARTELPSIFQGLLNSSARR